MAMVEPWRPGKHWRAFRKIKIKNQTLKVEDLVNLGKFYFLQLFCIDIALFLEAFSR